MFTAQLNGWYPDPLRLVVVDDGHNFGLLKRMRTLSINEPTKQVIGRPPKPANTSPMDISILRLDLLVQQTRVDA